MLGTQMQGDAHKNHLNTKIIAIKGQYRAKEFYVPK